MRIRFLAIFIKKADMEFIIQSIDNKLQSFFFI